MGVGIRLDKCGRSGTCLLPTNVVIATYRVVKYPSVFLVPVEQLAVD